MYCCSKVIKSVAYSVKYCDNMNYFVLIYMIWYSRKRAVRDANGASLTALTIYYNVNKFKFLQNCSNEGISTHISFSRSVSSTMST